MRYKSNLKIQRKNLFSDITYVSDGRGIIGTLKLSFLNNSAFFSGQELYTFHAIDYIGNSFRIYRKGKSIGYIHLHAFRNMAQINLVEEGPFQFSLRGFINGNWVLRQGKISIERMEDDLQFHHLESLEKELLVACGLFTASKINKDLILIVPFILLIWFLLILI
ncbi:hypothetical protein [Aquiflexum sp.]|uniref:hypothetical protein n=1 Tax=Aquiflexum sp. TaxID=1872584 RepID=UPI0035947ED6